MRLRVEELTEDAFSSFGAVLGQSQTAVPSIRDDVSDVCLRITDLMGIGGAPGRQVPCIRLHSQPKKYDRLEKHETSAEAFIPLEGTSVLVVVPAEAVDDSGGPNIQHSRAFLMDGSKGVLARPGTWQTVPFRLSDVATHLLLINDAIIDTGDVHTWYVEPMEFDL